MCAWGVSLGPWDNSLEFTLGVPRGIHLGHICAVMRSNARFSSIYVTAEVHCHIIVFKPMLSAEIKNLMKGRLILRGERSSLPALTQKLKFDYFVMFNKVVARLSEVPPNIITSALPEPELCKHMDNSGDIFLFDSPIYEEFQWYDLTLLEHLIRRVGEEGCERNLEEFKSNLKEYLASRRVLNRQCNKNTNNSPVYIQTDSEWESVFQSGGDAPKRYIASLLDLEEENLSFL